MEEAKQVKFEVNVMFGGVLSTSWVRSNGGTSLNVEVVNSLTCEYQQSSEPDELSGSIFPRSGCRKSWREYHLEIPGGLRNI
jgi:hypothetical protein